MEIVIEKYSDGYKADLKELPGSPPCGFGATKEMAVAHLFFMLMSQSNLTNYLFYANQFREELIVDGVKSELIGKQKR